MRLARLAWYTAVDLTYRTGLRGYCTQHDTLRWAWTHRDCCARQQAWAAELGPLIQEWLDRRDGDGSRT